MWEFLYNVKTILFERMIYLDTLWYTSRRTQLLQAKLFFIFTWLILVSKVQNIEVLSYTCSNMTYFGNLSYALTEHIEQIIM